ncbi:MAG: alpha/beta hydrolase [Sphingobacteriales bacterium]|nr:MAG: alpha/beta hydrolase [Sphingobacteriales bacterium]
MKRFVIRLLKILLIPFVLLNIIVICHAYKFTHFYEPGEITIKNQQEKTGWEKTKEILFGFNFTKSLNVKPDSAIKTTYFSTKCGLKLEAWEFTADSSIGTVALFHGHGGKKSSLLSEAAIFSKLGYNTILLDFRAHGGSQGNTCTIGYKEAEDVKLVYDYLVARGEKNIVLYGASLGAATITKAVNDYSISPAKIILDMPFGDLSSAITGRLKMMGLPAQPLGGMLTFWGGLQNGFWAFNHKPYEYVKKIECPVLLQRGKLDARVTQQETDLIYNNIHTAKKKVIYETAAHESLFKKEPLKWTAEVTAFLQ